MANPQKENGHIRIANEIAEALMQTQINGYQNRILWAIWRKTYGFNKSEDWISNSQLCIMTNLHKAHVCRGIKQLMVKKIVTKNGNKIKFNKDYSQWLELPKMVTAKIVTKNGNSVTKNGNLKLPKMADTINNSTKDNIQKTTPTPFKKIFDLFPNKKNKHLAEKIWGKLSESERLAAIDAVPHHIAQDYWQKDDGQFIPLLSTWLRDRRWEDVLKVSSSPPRSNARTAEEDFKLLTQQT